ncbi:hypothetical protein E2C01_085850 [Portunus trituberculatus]|uniref:Uncharacterized protein n=1 Tax=Portunus trituberculatus TaxID=210409 RepID=A0A5B7JBU1_PORTR|nr:hypothetical protein [Portunus trituberculatus]
MSLAIPHLSSQCHTCSPIPIPTFTTSPIHLMTIHPHTVTHTPVPPSLAPAPSHSCAREPHHACAHLPMARLKPGDQKGGRV